MSPAKILLTALRIVDCALLRINGQKIAEGVHLLNSRLRRNDPGLTSLTRLAENTMQSVSTYTRTDPILLPHFPRLFYLALLDRGFDDAQIFEGLDLAAEDLNDASYRLSVEQHERFILRMLDLANDAHFALKLLDYQDFSATNLPIMAVANSGQIEKSLHMLARYNRILTRVFTLHYQAGVDKPVMNVTVHLEHEKVIYFAVSSLALFLSHFFMGALKGERLVTGLDLTVPKPEGFDAVATEFPFIMRFDQPSCTVELDEKCLSRSMRQADPETVRLLTQMAEQQLRLAETESTLVGAVKSLLHERISDPPKLDDAAALLQLSPRGLRRKLAEADTSFQELLDSVRLSIARRLILETDQSIASIGYELGFTHPSDFGRAFKKWTGRSPGRIEKRTAKRRFIGSLRLWPYLHSLWPSMLFRIPMIQIRVRRLGWPLAATAT